MREDPAITEIRSYGLWERETASFRRMHRKTTIPGVSSENKEVNFPVRRKSPGYTMQAREKKVAGSARERIRGGRIREAGRSAAAASSRSSRRAGLERRALTTR